MSDSTTTIDLEQFQKNFSRKADDCPHCGRCKHCGRGGNDYYPTYPWYPRPYPSPWITWTVGTSTDGYTVS
jgi:hypothetical protein